MARRKQSEILEELRRDIVSGKMPPGSTVPPREELLVHFGTSWQTLQSAMNSLIKDGFITARRFGGTTVAERPPHLFNYGLVSYVPFSSSLYYMAARQAAAELEEMGTCKFTSYYYEEGRAQSDGFRSLVADVSARRVAGLIFLNPPQNLEGTPVLEQQGLPIVLNSGSSDLGDFHQIDFSHDNFVERAVDHLVGCGRKRIAIIGAYLGQTHIDRDVEYLMKRRISSPELVQSCSLKSGSAHQAALVLAKLSGKDRPDALIIRDDNLVETTTEGLAKSGLRIPQDMEVVAHCNFPTRAPSCVPVTRLGLDCHDMLLRDLECLNAQRVGRSFPEITEIPAIFEKELTLKKNEEVGNKHKEGKRKGRLQSGLANNHGVQQIRIRGGA